MILHSMKMLKTISFIEISLYNKAKNKTIISSTLSRLSSQYACQRCFSIKTVNYNNKIETVNDDWKNKVEQFMNDLQNKQIVNEKYIPVVSKKSKAEGNTVSIQNLF